MPDKKPEKKKSIHAGHQHAGSVKCEKCDREFDEAKATEYPGKVYVHQGRIMCEDCLVEMGVTPDDSESYRTWVGIKSDPGNVM